MFRSISVIALIFALLSSAMSVARWHGHRLDSFDPHLDTGDCEQPCWNGIKPGISDRHEVQGRAVRWITDPNAFYNSPYFVETEGIGDYMEVLQLATMGTGFKLAHALLFFGAPDTVRCECRECYPTQWIAVLLRFSQPQVEVELQVPDPLDRLAPDSEIAYVRYFAPDAAPADKLAESWRGFAPLGVYATCARVCDAASP